MDIRIEVVDPAKAESWLNLNKNNRKLRDGVVEQYAQDMKAGRWTNCPTPISFYADGDVADGQHRLWAIVESSTTQTFPVARGLDRADGLNIDTGLNRSVVDNSRISGVDTGLSNTLVAVARATQHGVASVGRMSNALKVECVDLHRDACTWAVANGPKGKNLRNAVVLAAISRAWYWEEDKSKLRRFCDVFDSGFQQGDEESAAVAMRNYMLLKAGLASSSAMWTDTFLKVQNAINYFMRSKKLTVIKGVKEEPYPLKKKRRLKP
ncbi:hypothetical protein D3C86_1178590 [compost metagenome]